MAMAPAAATLPTLQVERTDGVRSLASQEMGIRWADRFAETGGEGPAVDSRWNLLWQPDMLQGLSDKDPPERLTAGVRLAMPLAKVVGGVAGDLGGYLR